MAFVGYEQEASSGSVKSVSDLAPPANATHCELQADTNNIRYTMDGSTDPTTTVGMLLVTTHKPKQFLIADLRSIRFIQVAAGAGNLNVHYFSGRDV